MIHAFKTHNDDPTISPDGTSLAGECQPDTTYADLVAIFGEPGTGDEDKVDAEWDIKFDDGLIATIYNYKTGKNYLGEEGLSTDLLRGDDWHIGGVTKAVADRVNEIITDYHERKGIAAMPKSMVYPLAGMLDVLVGAVEAKSIRSNSLEMLENVQEQLIFRHAPNPNVLNHLTRAAFEHARGTVGEAYIRGTPWQEIMITLINDIEAALATEINARKFG